MFSLSSSLYRIGQRIGVSATQSLPQRTASSKSGTTVEAVVAEFKSKGFDPLAKSPHFDRAINEINQGTPASLFRAIDFLRFAEKDHAKISDPRTRDNLNTATNHLRAVCQKLLQK